MLVERLLAQAIQDFEPRIIPSTLKVKLDLEPATMSHNAMTFDIEGELWAQPLPLRIRLRTQLDLEAGQMRSEEHTSELQSLMRNSYAVFCLTQKKAYKH